MIGRTGWRRTLGLLVGAVLLAGCSAGPGRTDAPVRTTTTASPSTTAPTTTTTSTSPIATFTSSVAAVSAAQLGATWHAGCPVDPSQLRLINMIYWGFDGRSHMGAMVVNSSEVTAVIEVFATLYNERFPINEMVPQVAYGGDDNAAAAADDTSGFNCRFAVAPGPPQWSMHAYGEAIDVNDVQNPYVEGSTVIPAAGSVYLNRADVRPGMAVVDGDLVNAFAIVGWQWGGRWTGSPDYQHFSVNGK